MPKLNHIWSTTPADGVAHAARRSPSEEPGSLDGSLWDVSAVWILWEREDPHREHPRASLPIYMKVQLRIVSANPLEGVVLDENPGAHYPGGRRASLGPQKGDLIRFRPADVSRFLQ